MNIVEFMARHELLSSPDHPYDPANPHRQPRTDEERKARIAFLKAGNERLRAENERLRIADEQRKQKNAECIAAAAVEFQESEFAQGHTISTTEAVAHVINVPYDHRSATF